MATIKIPLLSRNHYHSGCPGCRMEQKKLENPGKLPYKEFLYVWLITLCTIIQTEKEVNSAYSYLDCDSLGWITTEDSKL